ncbi:DUF6455 family protein [Hoeflea prorocentri]|uniref:DUF6455 family protein n=1 Tax=Hoeflea prorocentri TaxID=1922333 RepID=A0A9X3UHF5_9HYPH|nr:DUF6455 family protein [Hoeflea prorocentri]MCY6380903.1 DUF6455 family protein [Hoeflea prorocentri]MDA5398703.1 DUF6455 family protein [Hoeflea prorocentri]
MKFQNFISRIDRHADLFNKMTEKLGVREDLADMNNVGPVSRRAALRCLSCANADDCENWLDKRTEPEEAPSYCRNRGLFARLKAAHPLHQE